MALVLGRDEVEQLLDLQTAVQVTKDTLREQGAGHAVARPPAHIDLPHEGALRIVSGALTESQRMGVRAIGAGPQTSGNGVALLFDSESAELLAVMAYPFGRLRTAAVFAVATDLLAAPDARRLAMIGTGRNAIGLLRAALTVRPVESARVYSRDPQRRAATASEAGDELGIPVEPASSIAEATEGAELVYVSTSSPVPVLKEAEVPPGALVAGMGTPSELDASVYLAADRVLVTSRVHEEGYGDTWPDASHTLLELDADGRLPWASVGELCQVASGHAPRRRDGETIVFRESQGGYGDVGLAAWIYARAREDGLGFEWDPT